MSKFPERIREARESMGLNKTDFAAVAGVSIANISRYESNDINVSLETVTDIAKRINVNPGWLLGWIDNKYEGINKNQLNMKQVPIIGVVAAGDPISAIESIEGYEYTEEDVDFCLKVKGDSMIGARIYDGDIVFVHRQSDIEHGEIAVVLVDSEEATLKRVFKFGNKVVLHPENPTMQDRTFSKTDKILTIIGKVKEVKFKPK